jgi:hypothetical protein
LFNGIALLARDTGTKRVGGKVTPYSDTSAADHLCVLRIEGWAVELGVVHVTNVLSILAVTVISFNNLVEERRELGVARVRACISSNTGINVLATRENGELEGDTSVILSVLKLVPDVSAQVLAEQTLVTLGEHGVAGELVRRLKVGATFHIRSISLLGASSLLGLDHGLDTIIHVLNKSGF